jgi:TPR repeat protein
LHSAKYDADRSNKKQGDPAGDYEKALHEIRWIFNKEYREKIKISKTDEKSQTKQQTQPLPTYVNTAESEEEIDLAAAIAAMADYPNPDEKPKPSSPASSSSSSSSSTSTQSEEVLSSSSSPLTTDDEEALKSVMSMSYDPSSIRYSLGHQDQVDIIVERAKQNNPEALFRLGSLWERGKFEKSIDIKRALGLYKKALEHGYSPAQAHIERLQQAQALTTTSSISSTSSVVTSSSFHKLPTPTTPTTSPQSPASSEPPVEPTGDSPAKK